MGQNGRGSVNGRRKRLTRREKPDATLMHRAVADSPSQKRSFSGIVSAPALSRILTGRTVAAKTRKPSPRESVRAVLACAISVARASAKVASDFRETL